MREEKRRMIPFFAVAAAFSLLLGGCASDGTLATQRLSAGERAIMDAREGNASLNAAAELNAAEGNLSEAKEAFAKKEYEKAARLADRASIDAEFARNKAATEKAKKNAEEMRKNIEALRREIERLSNK
jgi:predicted lipid-binding transport protein (Tim44 family)